MLTADLVRARAKAGELVVRGLDAPTRARLLPAIERYVEILDGGRGRSLDEIEDALGEVEVAARDRKVADGLCKLLLDRCTFAMDPGIDPPAIREAVFRRAAVARRAATDEAPFEREAVLVEAAAALGLSVQQVEDGLFADLRQAQRLQAFERVAAAALLDGYELEQAKAVLLRATKLVVEARFHDAGAARDFFRKLKFRRLLYRLLQRPDGVYHIEIEGPFGLFQSSTRYGLQLALLLPALRECAAFKLEAEVAWHKDQAPLKFRLAGEADEAVERRKARLPDDVRQLVERFRALECGWSVRPATKVLDLPGVGLCVPDLVFRHEASGQRVYLEVMGYWSRSAVVSRVELVERGLGEPVIFALSSRLRVSEAMLDAALPGELYVYKGVMSARAIAERLAARIKG